MTKVTERDPDEVIRWRVVTEGRLNVLEAGAVDLRRDIDASKVLIDAHGVTLAEQAAALAALTERVDQLEGPDEPPPPPPKRRTFKTHLPLELGRAQQGAAIAQRMSAYGETGGFLYQEANEPLVWNAGWQAIADTFPDGGVDLTVSPKNIEDLPGLTDWCRRWPEAVAQRMDVKFWQEPEDNFTTPEARAAFRANVQTCASIVRDFGMRNGVHLQGYALSETGPDYPHGPDIVADFIDLEHVDHIGWSMFEFNGRGSGPLQTDRVAAFMAARFPDTPWSFDAIGFSVPIGAQDDSRNRRAVNVQTAYAAIMATASEGLSWYDVINRDPAKMRDFLVDTRLEPVLMTTAGAWLGLPLRRRKGN